MYLGCIGACCRDWFIIQGKLKRAKLGGVKYKLKRSMTMKVFISAYIWPGACGLCLGKVNAMLDDSLVATGPQGIELDKNPAHGKLARSGSVTCPSRHGVNTTC